MPTVAELLGPTTITPPPAASASNPFDQFDTGQANPFDKFDGSNGGAAPAGLAQAAATGLGKDARSVMHGVGDIVDFVPDVLKAFYNLPGDVTQMVTGHDLGPRMPLHVTRDAADKIADQLGLPKDQTTLDRIGGAIIEGVTGSAGIGGALGALKGAPGFAGTIGEGAANPITNAAAGAGSGAAAQATAEAGGGPVAQTVASMLGGVAGGVAGHMATPSAPVVAPISAQPQGMLSRALAPFTAAVSKGAAEKAAAAKLAEAATDPNAVAAALDKPGEIVPGSEPTTYQQTGDQGLGQLERQVAKENPEPFLQRAAEQNSARRAALSDVETGGDPNDVAKALKQQFEDLSTEHEAKVQAATQAAHEATDKALGPEEYADALGANVRQALDTAETGAKAKEGALWKAVDPNGDMVGNVTATIKAAHDIPGDMAATAKPMSGEEAAIFDAARTLSPLSPVDDLIQLRSRVSSEMRQQFGLNGDANAARRLTMLKGAIEDNLSHTISQEVANEAAKAKGGILDPSNTIAARVQSWLNDWHAGRNIGAADGSGLSGGSASGSTGGASVLRAESPAPQGSGSPEGAPGVSSAPVFDQAARERLNAASASTAQRHQIYKSGPVGDVLATKGVKGRYALQDGSVAAKFFHPGPTSFQHMQAGLAAGAADFLPTIERFAATTLRRAALKSDGTLDPAKFETWRKTYADALRALPEDAKARYADAASASETMADVQAERAEALKAAQKGAIGRIMGLTEPEDVVKKVGQVLTGSTPIADMKALARAASKDPAAMAGLRRAVTDYIAAKFVGNTEVAGSGQTAIKADAYQGFIRQSRAALHLVFKPDEVRSMEAVAEDLQRSARSQTTKLPGGSNTAQDQAKTMKALAQAGQKTWLEIAGGVLGSHFGPLGTVGGILGAHMIRSLRAAGITRIDQLVSDAMLKPELARVLLRKAPRDTTHWSAASAPVTAALWNVGPAKNENQP